MIGYGAGSDIGRVEQRRARASPREWVTRKLHAFRVWRRTRPFWGGLLVIAGASEMLASEQAPLPVISQIGIRALAGYLTPIFMLLCGLLLWFTPIARTYHSLLVIVLALDSWLTANLGGFFIGVLISVVGAALAFAWMTDADFKSPGPARGKIKVRVASWASGVRAISPVTATIGALRRVRVTRPRRRPSPVTAPVQEALFELSTGPDPRVPRVRRPFAGRKSRRATADVNR